MATSFSWILALLVLVGCESSRHASSSTAEEFIFEQTLSPTGSDDQRDGSKKDSLQPLVDISVKSQTESSAQDDLVQAIAQMLPSAEAEKEASLETALIKELQDVYFSFDKASIQISAEPILEANAALLRAEYIDRNILLEGHCDARGSVEYNLVLGVRRAQAAQAYLENLGISQSRIRIVSYGKERPVCLEPYEECWEKNRRTHFVLQ